MSIESLKEQARRHEQLEEWGKALELYLRAIRQAAEDEQPDISLYNRAGDIQTRLGNLDGAVAHYEQAIDLYLDADLPNNAIAVCKKVLRNLPSRTGMFLRMGQVRASQGFLTDARQNFLTYAERMQKAGEMEEAFRALEEFADAAPEDVEIRLALASQLESHGRADEAVEQMRVAYAHLARSGAADAATEVRERILALDPEADLTVLPAAPARPSHSAPVGDAGFQLESTALEGEVPGEVAAPGIDPMAALEEEWGGEEAGDELSLPSDLPPGTETWDELPPEESLTFMEDESPGSSSADALLEEEDEGFGDEEGEEPLPFLELDAGDGAVLEVEFEDEIAVSSQEEGDLGFDLGMSLESEAEAAIDEVEAVDPLPLLEPEEADAADVVLEDMLIEEITLDSGFQDEEAEGGWSDRVEALMEAGEWEAAEAFLEEVHPTLMSAGDAEGAMEAVRLLLARNMDRVSLHQRLVEYSFRSADRSRAVPAFLGLAGALVRSGEEEKAAAVYRQVLALDGDNAAALEGLSVLEGAPSEDEAAPGEAGSMVEISTPPADPASSAPPPRAEAPPRPGPSDDFIDLGSLVLDDQPERTTRWFVPAEEPSGDDEADFAKMLSQFKSKVAENLAGDDATAHYDLGTAYKEMGLLQEAIAEFQQSLRADPRNLGTFEMLGQCFLDGGQPEVAVRTLDRAMALPFDVEDDLLGIYYYTGRAHETMGNAGRAREFYEKVFSLDINFKDVTERLRALR
jgi:tetratricopeptide (TPR) repeat protein